MLTKTAAGLASNIVRSKAAVWLLFFFFFLMIQLRSRETILYTVHSLNNFELFL